MIIILSVGVPLLNAVPVYYLWNLLMPDLFLLNKVTFFQAFGLVLLSSFLIKSSRYRRGSVLGKRLNKSIDAL